MKRNNRKECFLGVHFDFHAMPGETVGQVYQPDIVAKMLDEVKPDYVQCDTKGHAGLSSYPTRVGAQADMIANDVLRMWRDLTKERGIRLYAHHSGLYDRKVLEEHPDWGSVDREGNVSSEFVSVFSPYVDEILIPQLLELCEVYEMDGAWIDGDCWAAKVDYGKYAKEKYCEVTGISFKKNEVDVEEYEEFCRQGFKDYVKHYVKAIKSEKPDFEITSNWIYSAYMPEKPQFEPDFLSGDYASSNSVESARYHGRCLAARGMTWDLMAWGQNSVPGTWISRNRTTKELGQYCQEAAQVISMGGGFQFFNIMYGNGGTLQEWAIPMWGKVAEFCRERECACHGAEPYPEVAVIYASSKGVTKAGELYNPFERVSFTSLCAWINALVDNQISCNVLYEYQLRDRLPKYKAVVLPSTYDLEEDSVLALIQFVENGGKLILDAVAVKHFEKMLGLKAAFSEQPKLVFLDGGKALCCLETKILEIEKKDIQGKREVTGCYYLSNVYDESSGIAAWKQQVGEGMILVTCVDVGQSYNDNRSGAYNDFLLNQFNCLGYESKVIVRGSKLVDVILMQKSDMLLVNLVNMAGAHNVPGVRSYNEIPPLGPLNVSIIVGEEPAEVYLEPRRRKVDYEYRDGKIIVTIPKLEIHEVIVVKEGKYGL